MKNKLISLMMIFIFSLITFTPNSYANNDESYNYNNYVLLNNLFVTKYWNKLEKMYEGNIGSYNFIMNKFYNIYKEKCSETGKMDYCYLSDSAFNNKLYKVTKVADGDTITIQEDLLGSESNKYRVRMIGIDTPETVDPRKPVQCFGKEASNFAKEILNGKIVKIQTDPTQDKIDKYGRLLGYVYYKDGENFINFNLLTISNGYAFEYTYKYPYVFQDLFKNSEKIARENNVGLWNVNTCNGIHDSVENVNDILNKTSNDVNDILNDDNNISNNIINDDECKIKGNISSKGLKQYYFEDDRGYKQVKINKEGEKYFCTEEEAINEGFEYRWK